MLLQQIILNSLNNIQEERTVNSIYHLLTGKQSIQTIQDAHLFQLESFFALYRRLRMKEFNDQLQHLIDHNYIKPSEPNTFKLTSLGSEFIRENSLHTYHWNGMEFRQVDDEFSKRLFLIIQVWTNRHANINKYIPIIDDWTTTNWVKKFYRQEGMDVESLLRQLYQSLVTIFSKLEPIYPEMFLKQITTSKSIGLTNEQLAEQLAQSTSNIYLREKNYLHFILKEIKDNGKKYALLSRMTEDLYKGQKINTVTGSADITKKLVLDGMAPEEIARNRQLKMTTIYDHLVEIALYDDRFPIYWFITKEEEKEIYEAVKKIKSFKLKEIKTHVSEEISFFQIRLALTKLNKVNGGEIKDA